MAGLGVEKDLDIGPLRRRSRHRVDLRPRNVRVLQPIVQLHRAVHLGEFGVMLGDAHAVERHRGIDAGPRRGDEGHAAAGAEAQRKNFAVRKRLRAQPLHRGADIAAGGIDVEGGEPRPGGVAVRAFEGELARISGAPEQIRYQRVEAAPRIIFRHVAIVLSDAEHLGEDHDARRIAVFRPRQIGVECAAAVAAPARSSAS